MFFFSGSISELKTQQLTKAAPRSTSALGAAPATTAAPGSRRSYGWSSREMPWSSAESSSNRERSSWSLNRSNITSESCRSSNKSIFTGGSGALGAAEGSIGGRRGGPRGDAHKLTPPAPPHTILMDTNESFIADFSCATRGFLSGS